MGRILGGKNWKTKFNLLNNLLPPELHHFNLICYDMGEGFSLKGVLNKAVQEAGCHEGAELGLQTSAK
jgi:hypothetical protein